jgi:hypothetical protein
MAHGSRRLTILETLRSRVQAIRTGADFDTNAGQLTFVGDALELGPDDPDEAIAIIAGDEVPQHVGENVQSILPINIVALAKADVSDPYLAAEAVIGDIKRAVELPDRFLGGASRWYLERGITRIVPREPGTTTVGVAIEYRATIVEKWGDP